MAADGGPLPSPRLVSFVLHHDVSERDIHVTFLLVAFGQILDHDMTLAMPTQDEFGLDIECCRHPESQRHPNCIPIALPRDDPFFKFFKRTCMDFVRVLPGLKPGCPLGPRSQTNTISSFIDANFIYGSSQEVASRLREHKQGRLKTSPLYRDIGLKDLLPMKTIDPDHGCERKGRPRNLYCFDAGDERVNEQLALTVMHTIWMREHNRVVSALAAIHVSWDDETLYQEARRIVVSEVQHIVFNEWLPVVLGRKIMNRYGLDLAEEGHYAGYDPKVNGGIRLAFQAAAMRFGHSVLPDVTERYNKHHEKLGKFVKPTFESCNIPQLIHCFPSLRTEAIRLSQLLRQPYELYKPGILDTFVLGLINQEANRMDPEITTEVTNHLFERPGEHFGMDLAAMNLQRGRETGLPGYNAFREYCGLSKAVTFTDLAGSFDNRTIHRFASLYRSVDDIELWSAGVSEFPAPGALLGPVFSCIIAEQFANVRKGDRFWYENAGWPGSLSVVQLNEVRKAKMARILCDNTDDLATIQLFPFLAANPVS